MARVTIEDCLKNVDNRFTLVHLAAKRVRQIREGADLLVKSSKNGDVVSVLREIAANRIVIKKNKDKDDE
ncbi:MAG: DNA-directed RNA polymerase subunit omega [Desulfobacula sp.]